MNLLFGFLNSSKLNLHVLSLLDNLFKILGPKPYYGSSIKGIHLNNLHVRLRLIFLNELNTSGLKEIRVHNEARIEVLSAQMDKEPTFEEVLYHFCSVKTKTFSGNWSFSIPIMKGCLGLRPCGEVSGAVFFLAASSSLLFLFQPVRKDSPTFSTARGENKLGQARL